uniref:Serpentine receptor class gamma n=1 Tax=Panagrellus redivivus TaxID=6233 RepID=A0A7E4WB94_PANRE
MDNETIIVAPLSLLILSDAVLYLNWIGAIFPATVAVFLFYTNFKPAVYGEINVKSSYFNLLASGFAVHAFNIIFWCCLRIVAYDLNSIFTPMGGLVIWYSSYFEGICEFVLACNRCTALTMPMMYKRIWSGFTFVIIILFVYLFPFICNGYTFLTNIHCRLYFFSMECFVFQQQSTFTTAMTLVCLSFASLFVVGIGRLKTKNASKNLNKVSKLLFYQTTFIAACQFCGSTTFAIKHFSAVVLFFLVSHEVRRGYCKFYHLNFLIRRSDTIKIVSHQSTVKPRSNTVVLHL